MENPQDSKIITDAQSSTLFLRSKSSRKLEET